MNLSHGGDLETAAKTFGIKKTDWLDLSTGINPHSWPVPVVPADIWRRLPALNKELIASARIYYQCNSILPVPGSQSAIQTLPVLFPRCRVAIPVIGYQEHKIAWEKAGHDIIFYSDEQLDELDARIESGQVKHVVVINPNNPSCKIIEKNQLESWLMKLRQRNGYLIIDETFMDTTPEFSMVEHMDSGNLIILRSLGKFFGLAGVRLGFLLAHTDICNNVQQQLGPWAVSGPAQWIGIQVLSDTSWQQNNRQWLKEESTHLRDYLENILDHEIISIKHTLLYVTVILEESVATFLYEQLGKQGILVRYIPFNNQHACIRFGLLKDSEQWLRFKTAMETIICQNSS